LYTRVYTQGGIHTVVHPGIGRYTPLYTPGYREVYTTVHTQGGYRGGIPRYTHTGRLYGRYTPVIHPGRLVRRYTPVIHPGRLVRRYTRVYASHSPFVGGYASLFSRFTVGHCLPTTLVTVLGAHMGEREAQ